MASERTADEFDYGDDIDQLTFDQILEMDDDDDEREFSSQIVFDFFEQAKGTLESMDEQVKKKDLQQLSQLGHFLKGSSATLGLIKVREACEKIQNWGAEKDDIGEHPIGKEDALTRIRNILPTLKGNCKAAEIRLRAFYEQ